MIYHTHLICTHWLTMIEKLHEMWPFTLNFYILHVIKILKFSVLCILFFSLDSHTWYTRYTSVLSRSWQNCPYQGHTHADIYPYLPLQFPSKGQMIRPMRLPTWQLSGLSVRARMGRADQRGSGGRKSPKQELMSIIVLGKNKPHLKSHRIPKQLQ